MNTEINQLLESILKKHIKFKNMSLVNNIKNRIPVLFDLQVFQEMELIRDSEINEIL